MSPIAIALLVAAAVLLVAAEWSRLRRRATPRVRRPARRAQAAAAQGRSLKVVRPDSEEFARAVERDLAALPTIDEHDVEALR